MFLRSRANIDYKFKCAMLQEVARKEAQEKPQPTIKSSRQHQRRVSFSDEMKKTYLKENSSCNAGTTAGSSSSSGGGGGGGGGGSSSSTASSSASSSSSTATTATNLQSRYNDNDQLANLLAKK